ncbi:glycogen synthase [bacterium]|nr:glycogen synthase [bacterium]MBU1989155.1 glycogen synthase [bacterium]
MKTLFAASEIFPHAKSGGLADVAGTLPKYLSKELDVSCVMPLYGFMQNSSLKKEDLAFSVYLGGVDYEVEIFSSLSDGVKIYFVHAPMLSHTQSLYGDENGDFSNNDLRFGIFCASIVELAQKLQIELLHLNDWHTALVPLMVQEKNLDIKTVFSIHNLAYQGVFDISSLSRLGIDEKYFTMEGIEFYGSVNFMKAGIAYSDVITTVSPRYAKEILTSRFGCGLEGFLKHHSKKLFGILNGIDVSTFNPHADDDLEYNYDGKNLEDKYLNKKGLVKKLGLKDPRIPLFVMVSRLVHQKGFDLLLESIKPMLKKRLNLLILVEGASGYRQKLEEVADKHDNFCMLYGYNEKLSHQVYAAGDFLLMPSLFEPCGLNQMIAMRYATVPVVHAVGGLYDSVHEDKEECGRGIVFTKASKKAFMDAIERALELKRNKKKMDELIRFNMACDFSFEKSAKSYVELYKNTVC